MSKAPWKPLDVGLGVLFSAVAIVAVTLVASVFIQPLGPNGADPFPDSEGLLGVPLVFVLSAVAQGAFLVGALIFSVSKYGVGVSHLGFVRPLGRFPYVFALAAWLAGLAGVFLWSLAVESLNVEWLIPPDNARETLEQVGGSLAVTFLLVGVWAPVTEEVFFRGFALQGLLHRYGRVGAVILSSGLFALFHIDPALFAPTFILGLTLSWVYLRTGSIWPCIFVHGVHNTMAVILAKWSGALAWA